MLKGKGTPDYGSCPICGEALQPVWFNEEQTIVKDGCMDKTGKKRRAVSHLECSACMHKEAVDDTFDGPWM